MSLLKYEPFNATTIVRPAPGSSKFFRKDSSSMSKATLDTYGINEFKERVLMDSTPYEFERFQGTIQVFGLEFNYYKNRWLIIDPEDITKRKELEDNSEVLNSLVSACKLTVDKKDHPDYGQYITKCDIFDRNDPFFTHNSTRLDLDGGEAIIPSNSKSNPKNVIILLGWLARKMFSLGSGSPAGSKGVQIKYIILDKTIEKAEKREKRSLRKKAMEYLSNLDKDRKYKVAIALDLIKRTTADLEDVEDYLDAYALDDKTKSNFDNRYTKQEVFVNLIEAGGSELEAHYTFNLAFNLGIIRRMDRSYTYKGAKIGDNKNQVISVLMSPNDDLLENLQDDCDTSILAGDVRKHNQKLENIEKMKSKNTSKNDTKEEESKSVLEESNDDVSLGTIKSD